jgi:hypothetical protein
MLNHQKRAKYCIKIQEDLGNIKPSDMKQCTYCLKIMSSHNYSRHLINCSIRKDNIIKKFQDDILSKNIIIEKITSELEIYKNLNKISTECIQELAKQPNITNIQNNKWINVAPFSLLSDEKEQDKLGLLLEEKFNDDHFNSGQKGLARWAHKHLLTDDKGNILYKCTNSSLDVFKYKNEHGDICKDIQAKKLSILLGEKVKPLTKRKIASMTENFGSDEWDICYENAQELNHIAENNSSFRKEIRCLTSK